MNSSGASAFQKLAVWEGGYNVSLDICRESDSYDQSNVITHQLKSAATGTILHLSKAASLKLGRQYVRSLRDAYISTKQMATLLLLCHDLSYTNTESFLALNRKLNEFSGKLFKYTRYCQKKLRKRIEGA